MAYTRLMARSSAIDRLSALSDDVLLNHILSKISYRDVVRSSLLSQRWRLLWTKIPRLKFCPEDFEKQKDGRIQAIINNALLHLDTRLSCLELTVALDDPKAAYINNWIRLAAEKQVERMDIHICNRDPKTGKRISNGASPMMELGDSIFSCENLTVLTVQYIQLPKMPTNFGVFRSLKAVRYAGIPNLDDAMFEGFMDLCPHLQDLGILRCLGLKNLNIQSSNLMWIHLGALRPDISLQLTCPRLMEIGLIDSGQYAGLKWLKLLQQISRAKSVKKVILQNYNTGNAVNPGMPSIIVLNSFPGLEELTIHGQCFQEMISDEMPTAEVALPNLKMVRAHIGPDKGAQAVIFLGFLLRNSPLSVTRVFLPEHCPPIMQNNILNLERDFSKSRLSTATKTWSMNLKAVCQLCTRRVEYYSQT
ncbi:putative FBD-associated F-box protein At5g56440 [Cryptomeria japonica]|uniref:putative FBD-associated F-box protein At5g56440 n=1 Tax=Cryptomeria japonica TaxID=3369 RepID=UPI0027D9D973|nr:putative FBD-associated F-box protein At5g56440 [Cryptomeria japonica]